MIKGRSLKEVLDLETYREAVELRRIGILAVRKTQEKNRRLGIPNAYSHQGRLYYELPNGEVTGQDSFEGGSESGMRNNGINSRTLVRSALAEGVCCCCHIKDNGPEYAVGPGPVMPDIIPRSQ